MKTNTIKYLFFWIFILFSVFLSAAPSEAEFRKLTETWTLHQDGSQEYRYYKELTLFTHTAMNSTYGQTFITYNPDFQELKIHCAYVKQKDGTTVQTPDNAFVEVLPAGAADAPAYNRLKEMVIVHTGLELGATIYLDYSVISKAGYLPAIDVCKPLEESSPIKEYNLIFNLPASVTPHYALLQLKAQPQKSQYQSMQQLKWTFRNLPAQSRERGIGLQNGDLAGILFTTYPTAAQALQNLYRQFDPAPTPQIQELAQLITEGYQSKAEQITRIQHYIQTELSDCPLPLSETDFRFRPSAEVIRTAYGTGIEKINLMTNLLRAAGIEAIPAAAYSIPSETDNCGLNAVREFVVLAKADGRSYRLGIQNTDPAATDCTFLIDLIQGKKSTPEQPIASIGYQASIVITPQQEADMDIKATFDHLLIPYTSNYAGSLLPGIQEYTITPGEKTTTISGKGKAGLKQEENYYFFYLPTCYKGITGKSYASYNTSRSKNLYLPALVDENYSYDIQLPENLTLCTLVQEKKIDNPIGSFKMTLTSKGSILHIELALQIKKQLITPAEYPAFRDLVTEWTDRSGKPILFKTAQ